MNIIFGPAAAEADTTKYTILELDTVQVAGHNEAITAYCVIEKLPLTEVVTLEEFQNLHQNLIRNFKLKNWNYCRNAIEHLHGHWNNELDTFYDSIIDRVNKYELEDPGPDWTGLINRN